MYHQPWRVRAPVDPRFSLHNRTLHRINILRYTRRPSRIIRANSPLPSREGRRRLKVLISAYAFRPDWGSEPGIGWNTAVGMAKQHDVWVLTSIKEKRYIEDALRSDAVSGLHVCYHSFGPDRKIPGVGILVQFHYYFWQMTLFLSARKLHRSIAFDLTHHVTYTRYWMPNTLAFLPVPFVFGPVGGGESTPAALMRGLDRKSRRFEWIRNFVRRSSELDPFVRATAKRSAMALATTPETARALSKLGARHVRHQNASNLGDEDLSVLTAIPPPPERPFRVISMARLISWKGIHLGLRAFARANIIAGEYWVLGDGPLRGNLEELVQQLGIAGRVRFFGMIERRQALELLRHCHVLMHPSFHDSDGFVCKEAMAAARPVLCLAAGGPGMDVPDGAGYRVDVNSADDVVARMAKHLAELASDPAMCAQMGHVGRAHALAHFNWNARIAQFCGIYAEVVFGRDHVGRGIKSAP